MPGEADQKRSRAEREDRSLPILGSSGSSHQQAALWMVKRCWTQTWQTPFPGRICPPGTAQRMSCHWEPVLERLLLHKKTWQIVQTHMYSKALNRISDNPILSNFIKWSGIGRYLEIIGLSDSISLVGWHSALIRNALTIFGQPWLQVTSGVKFCPDKMWVTFCPDY